MTHHAREQLVLDETTFTFVTEGVEAAVERAAEAAGGEGVHISGGADVIQQCIRAGLVDVLDLHVVPIFLGDGRRLLDGLDPARLEVERVIAAPRATHIRYRL